VPSGGYPPFGRVWTDGPEAYVVYTFSTPFRGTPASIYAMYLNIVILKLKTYQISVARNSVPMIEGILTLAKVAT
jgi:hypothetical protein